MLCSLQIGKIDAGIAVMLTSDMRVIEFPSILLPEGIKSGSIVDINVSRNHAQEAQKEKDFRNLQQEIWEKFGKHSPKAPVLRCRNTTQTAVVLEWDQLDLATANLRSLAIYRNGEKMGKIPDPLHNTSTKISGLAIDRDYTFQLELRTSSGQYKSELLKVHTHKMTELSGIRVTAGVMADQLKESLERAVERIGGEMVDGVRLDTTHFVCTEGRGRDWERAKDMNVPVVRPEWVEGCEREGRMVGVKEYYLDANPKLRQIGQGASGTASSNGTGQVNPAEASRESLPGSAQPGTQRETPGTTIAASSQTSLSGNQLDSTAALGTPRDRASESDEDSEEEEKQEKDDENDEGDDEDDDDAGDLGRDQSSPAASHGQRRAQEDDEERDPGTPSNFEDVAL